MICSSRFCSTGQSRASAMIGRGAATHLEPLVLQDTLDGSIFSRGRKLGLKDNTKGAIADNLALGVLQVPRLPCDAVLHLLTNDLCDVNVRERAYRMLSP